VRGGIERATDNAAIDRLINVSDDGQTMAFVSSRTGKDEVWIRDVPTGRDRQLMYPNARAARVSRDGSRVAVDRGMPEKRGIDLVSLRGGPLVPLCEGCNAGDWSPDGKHLVIQRGSPSRLLVRELDSGRERELAAHPTWNLYRPRFSPDGRWVVFHTTNSPTLRQIYAVPAFGGAPVAVEAWISVVPDFGVQPSWAPDGAAVYYFSLRDGAFCAWLQPLDPATKRPAGSPRAVQHFHRPALRAVTGAEVTNHVAGGYLYVTLTSYAANIWMLTR
jgi:Tol biopolymer transport system component